MNKVMPPPHRPGFSGSYPPEDVKFLLKRVRMSPTPVDEKERRIQTGAAHYSEMISEEPRPDARYLALFEAACTSGVPQLARDVRALTGQVLDMIRAGRLNREVTLCSLVRAGVPYGVLLRRDLARAGLDVSHFGVSIIRDRGLDAVAMRHVLSGRPADGVIFVDGWTGKGAIANELDRSWRTISGKAPLLAVIADPCGRADLCASREDWLIPSGILGGNVSGLISRSILRSDLIGRGIFTAASFWSTSQIWTCPSILWTGLTRIFMSWARADRHMRTRGRTRRSGSGTLRRTRSGRSRAGTVSGTLTGSSRGSRRRPARCSAGGRNVCSSEARRGILIWRPLFIFVSGMRCRWSRTPC